MAKRCEATKTDGSPCGAFAGKGTRFCLAHDPGRREQAQEGRSKGGAATAPRTAPRVDACLSPEEVGPPPTTREEMLRVLGETTQAVRCGRLDPRRGAVVMGIVKLQLRVLADAGPGPAPETDHSGMSDAELLGELERQAEMARHRIAAHAKEGTPPSLIRGSAPRPTHNPVLKSSIDTES